MKGLDSVAAQRSSNTLAPSKKDADYVFYELTRSICPECRRVIDAQIILRMTNFCGPPHTTLPPRLVTCWSATMP